MNLGDTIQSTAPGICCLPVSALKAKALLTRPPWVPLGPMPTPGSDHPQLRNSESSHTSQDQGPLDFFPAGAPRVQSHLYGGASLCLALESPRVNDIRGCVPKGLLSSRKGRKIMGTISRISSSNVK